MAGFTLTSSSSVATRDSSSELGSPLAAPSVQHSSSELGSAFGLRSNSSFNIVVRNIVPYVRLMSIGGYDDEAYEGKNERHVGGRKTKI